MDKIIQNLDDAIKSGVTKAKTLTVSTELNELYDKVGEVIEYLTKRVTKNEIDLPVIIMLHLMDSSNSIQKAIKEYEAFKEKE